MGRRTSFSTVDMSQVARVSFGCTLAHAEHVARWAANAPDSFVFRAVGTGFGHQLVSLKLPAMLASQEHKSSWQLANSDWPLLFHCTERRLQYLLRTSLKKFLPETSAYYVGLIGQTHTFIDNLRLAIRMSHLSSKC